MRREPTEGTVNTMSDETGDYEYLTRRIVTGRAGDNEINRLTAQGWQIADRTAPKGRVTIVTFKRDRVQQRHNGSAPSAAQAAKRQAESERRAALTPEQRSAEDKRNVIIGAVMVAVIVGIVAVLYAVGSSRTDSKTTPRSPSTHTASSPASADVRVPLVTGWRLDKATTEMRNAGLFAVGHDCSGQSRVVIRESNWRVVTQDPQPGALVPADTEVSLCSVKDSD